uniref:Roadblock/LAMTOR2 domain-containing protein n=1 Tax=Zooxanthella nutricula TaxID=1333877 RepID=A0A7S2PRG0_9DINO
MSGIVTVQTALTQLCKQNNSNGLRSITVTDRDGIVVLRAPESVIDDQNADQILTTIFSLTTEQTSKIQELGQANFIMTMYDNCICLQANHLPLVIRMIAAKGANAGALIELLPQVKAVLGPTKDVITRETENY